MKMLETSVKGLYVVMSKVLSYEEPDCYELVAHLPWDDVENHYFHCFFGTAEEAMEIMTAWYEDTIANGY